MSRSFGVGFVIGASVSPTVASSFRSVDRQVQDTRKALSAASKEAKTLRSAIDLRASRDDLSARLTASGGTDTALRKELNKTEQAYRKAATAAMAYGGSVDEWAKRHESAVGKLERHNAQLRKFDTAQSLQAESARRGDMYRGMIGTVAQGMMLAQPIRAAMGFQTAMAGVRKVTNFDVAGLKAFSDELLNMSTRIPMSAEALTEIAAAAGQAGIAQSELLRFTEDAAVMATAFDMTASDAGSAMTGMRTNFKLTQDGVRLLGDSINHLSNSYDAKAGELVDFVSRVGGTAATFGVTGQQVAALGAAFRATKVDTESASTAANAMFVRLGNATKLPKEAQKALEGMGFSAQGMARAMQEDAQGAITEFMRRVKESKNPLAVLSSVFGVEHAPKIVKIANSFELYESALKDATDQTAYAGSQQEEFKNVTDTVGAKMQLATNAINKTAITLGDKLLPPLARTLEMLTPIISGIGDWASQHETLTTVLVGGVAAMLGLRVAAQGIGLAMSFARTGVTAARGVLSLFIPSLRKTAMAEKGHATEALSSAAASRSVAAGSRSAASGLRAEAGAARSATAGLRTQSGAARIAGKAVGILGKGFRVLLGPVGIIITVFEALYNNVEWVRDAVDGFFTYMSDTFPRLGGVLKGVAGFFGIGDGEGEGGDAGESTAEATASQAVAARTASGMPKSVDTSHREVGTRPATVPSAASMAGDPLASAWQTLLLDENPTIPPAPPSRAKTPTSSISSSAPSSPSAPASRPGAPGTSGASAPAINMNFHISGITDSGFTQRLMDALRQNSGQFERIIADIVHNQERLAHG